MQADGPRIVALAVAFFGGLAALVLLAGFTAGGAGNGGALDLRIDGSGVVTGQEVAFGAQDRFLNTFADLQRLAPVVPLAGADARFQPVWVEDVAQAVVACLSDEFEHRSIGEIYEACGPETFTLKELVQLAGRISGAAGGHGRPVIGLPDALARLQLRGEPLAIGIHRFRAAGNLQALGLIQYARGRVAVLDRDGLEARACECYQVVRSEIARLLNPPDRAA